MNARLRLAFCSILAALGVSSVHAAIQTQDTGREAAEKGTADCMSAARKAKQQELTPRQGTRSSVQSPGSGGGQSTTGQLPVLGNPSSGNFSSSPATAAPTTVNSIDVSAAAQPAPLNSIQLGGAGLASATPASVPLSQLAPGVALTNTQNVLAAVQVGAALAQMAAATGNNQNTLNGLSGAIGAIDQLQGAWDQNSVNRLGGAQIWNQSVAAKTLALQILTRRLLTAITQQSQTARMISYDPSSATLANGPSAAPSDNGMASTPSLSSPAAIGQALRSYQNTSSAAPVVTPLWTGTTTTVAATSNAAPAP